VDALEKYHLKTLLISCIVKGRRQVAAAADSSSHAADNSRSFFGRLSHDSLTPCSILRGEEKSQRLLTHRMQYTRESRVVWQKRASLYTLYDLCKQA
jgi:hypothetical protein